MQIHIAWVCGVYEEQIQINIKMTFNTVMLISMQKLELKTSWISTEFDNLISSICSCCSCMLTHSHTPRAIGDVFNNTCVFLTMSSLMFKVKMIFSSWSWSWMFELHGTGRRINIQQMKVESFYESTESLTLRLGAILVQIFSLKTWDVKNELRAEFKVKEETCSA